MDAETIMRRLEARLVQALRDASKGDRAYVREHMGYIVALRDVCDSLHLRGEWSLCTHALTVLEAVFLGLKKPEDCYECLLGKPLKELADVAIDALKAEVGK